MKKIFSIMAVVAVMTVFASCSKSTTTENNTCSDTIECVDNDSCDSTAETVAVDCDSVK